MLDSERFRYLNISIFTCMGFTTSIMVTDPTGLDVPYLGFTFDSFNSTLRRMLVIAYFFIIYAPIIMGIPRYDLYGIVMATIYTWSWIVHIIIRDYACGYFLVNIAFRMTEYLSWLFLGVTLIYYLIKLSCSPFTEGSFSKLYN